MKKNTFTKNYKLQSSQRDLCVKNTRSSERQLYFLLRNDFTDENEEKVHVSEDKE